MEGSPSQNLKGEKRWKQLVRQKVRPKFVDRQRSELSTEDSKESHTVLKTQIKRIPTIPVFVRKETCSDHGNHW